MSSRPVSPDELTRARTVRAHAHHQVDPGQDGREFRRVLGSFCSGITILTASVDGEPVGMTCQSFFSVSLDPPLVSFCVSRSSTTYPVLREADGFVVNVLGTDQELLSSHFAARGADRWTGVDWSPSSITGSPVLADSLAVLDCAVDAEIAAGDHILVVARVLGMRARDDAGPLLYYRGAYRRLHDAVRPTGAAALRRGGAE
ncbi:flavin reductase family protein [Pseudonocardia sp. KRD-184]|uniref:Flavin reductase family protein n=1 Tax=Pseudonocardia oceani TaxID=2792013 RepID=A0ABS6U4D2_9PSEU|nr:flavin reductase family protein [Pseudonocardia oceani]MBW0096995.1 flavin reductase family protein [Pseudonocardia oceani]MBW0110153.1 flavin reductase family protein [Pseudonocardia oceani]MBW0121622.1 flavin reductase family protein [Pseudonocardia oceani]MBW0127088.1 flavin reductase family protein [Pseudonocardia oceani]